MSMVYDLEVVGLQELMRDARASGANAVPLIHGAIVNSTNKIQAEARQRAAHRTGTLQRSIMPEVKAVEGLVAVNEKYGQWLERGTGLFGPYRTPIVPVRKKVLVFRVGGRTVVARSVKGMRARPFFQPAIEISQPYIKEQFDTVATVLRDQLSGTRSF